MKIYSDNKGRKENNSKISNDRYYGQRNNVYAMTLGFDF